ncbi:MAG: hypothetical protein Q7U64_01305 [Desulfocapsaceae bacterium]|nr:hypothetical protein [Desulfocapsaceae bacterium]
MHTFHRCKLAIAPEVGEGHFAQLSADPGIEGQPDVTANTQRALRVLLDRPDDLSFVIIGIERRRHIEHNNQY